MGSNNEYEHQQSWLKEDGWKEIYNYVKGIIYNKDKTYITLHDSKPDIGVLYPNGKTELIQNFTKETSNKIKSIE